MAKAHVLTGVVFVTATGWLAHFSPTFMVLAITSVPGFALLPDIDHAKSMVSSTYGFATRVFSLLLGHRRETHSYPGIAVFGLVTWLATVFNSNVVAKIWLTLLLVLGWAALLRTFKFNGGLADLLPFAFAIPIVWFRPEMLASGLPPYPLEFIPLAVVFGMLLHVAGDLLTNSGCPLWWPFSKKRTAFRFKLRPGGKVRSLKTNSKFEHKIVVPGLWLAIAGTIVLWVQGLVA